MGAIADHLHRVMAAGGDAVAIEFEGRSLSWSALAAAAADLDATLDRHGIASDAAIGLLGRNHIDVVAVFLAALAADRGLVLINALRPAGLIAEELGELGLACVIAAPGDLGDDVLAAARRTGTMAVGATIMSERLNLVALTPLGDQPHRRREQGTLIEIQTSGTTGKPKRIPVLERTMAASLKDGIRRASGTIESEQLAPKGSPALMFSPLVHTSGTFNTLMAIFEVRPIVLFEKFDAEQYRRALVRYRPKFAPLPPTALKMMVDSEATREDFSSVLAVRAGTAPLSVTLQQEFEDKFGVPVLTTYGATEFMGAVASWTLDDHRQFGVAKRGSVGRVNKGCELRVIDPVTGDPLGPDQQGILEARLDRLDGGEKWIRTTDLARFDADGFLYIEGRADDAIIRGGFKVMAEKVADVVRQAPGVYDAIVMGVPDERLGEIPVAAVEPYPGALLTEAELRDFAKARLTGYEVPVRFVFLDKLPRTVSDKVARAEVRKLLEA